MRLAPRSLAGRLLLASAVATLLAMGLVLALTGQVMTRFITGQIDQRLDNKIVALASELRPVPDGTLSLAGEADGPPFDRPEHRSFWIVRGARNALRSRWLQWDDVELPEPAAIASALARPGPPDPPPGGLPMHPRTFDVAGLGTRLHLRAAIVAAGPATALIMVAAPAEAIGTPLREAMATLGLGVLALGVALAALAFLQIRLGLAPLAALRAAVVAVAEGRRDRLPEAQPSEVAPLVAELNRLLAANAANLDQARRHVAHLAHGLTTPLATLSLRMERLHGPETDGLRRLLAEIDLRIRHHLGRARAGALAGPTRTRTLLAPRLGDLGDALTRLHAERGVALVLDAAPDVAVACDGQDVDEIFGNLIDNAFRFALSRVCCTVRLEGRRALITIADDGPGLSAAEVATVLQPGRRLDEATPGFGFGLTIARELVELYGGDLGFETATAGLTVTVRLPLSDGLAQSESTGLPAA